MDIDFSSHIPVYVQIKDQLQAEINARNLQTGDALPTLAGICDMAGVSMRTAQRAVALMLKEGIGKRIGRQLVVGDTPLPCTRVVKSIFIVACDFSLNDGGGWVGDQILKGISEEVAKEVDSELVLAAPDFVNSLQYYLNQKNPSMQVCGVLLLHCQRFDVLEELLEQYPQVNFMQMNYYLDGIETLPENLYGVFNDDFAGSYKAVEYLVDELKCQQPVFWELSCPDQVYQERRRGFLSALADRGKNGRAFLQLSRPPSHPPNETLNIYYNAFSSLYEQAEDLDGIFCCNDYMAAAAAQFLEDHGKAHIPVVGYDNYIHQSLRKTTTIGVDFVRMGRVAVQRLRQNSGLRFTKILPQLILRKQQKHTYMPTKQVFQVFNAISSVPVRN
ncbi:MAG: substrate-binding domain-containing protein [Oligosphaeraceae bacterium]|nr:substrate-binding domain-containing protein [Oligosphaeraceae bacterium]